MADSEEDFDNLRPIVSYLDTMRETEDGSFEQTQPIPGAILHINFGELAALCDEFGRENYEEDDDCKKALRSYTHELKLLTLWRLYQYPQARDARLQKRRSGWRQQQKMEIPYVVEREIEQIEKRLSSAYYNRGNTYDELDEYKKAIKDYDRALDLPNREPWNVLLNRALVYERLGRFREAERDVSQAYQQAPERMPNIERSLDRIRSEHRAMKGGGFLLYLIAKTFKRS